eukprot:6770529-Alexandrium_andersonii.AAC.1
MSASLVGSEMCIRDRGALVSCSARTALLALPLGQHHPVAHILRLRVAVSYTHLTLPTICSV